MILPSVWRTCTPSIPKQIKAFNFGGMVVNREANSSSWRCFLRSMKNYPQSGMGKSHFSRRKHCSGSCFLHFPILILVVVGACCCLSIHCTSLSFSHYLSFSFSPRASYFSHVCLSCLLSSPSFLCVSSSPLLEDQTNPSSADSDRTFGFEKATLCCCCASIDLEQDKELNSL